MPAGKTTSAAAAEKIEAVYAAIAALGEATANEIAAQAGMAYPTVTPKLRALAEGGRAEFFKDTTGKGKWRTTTPNAVQEHQPDPDPAAVAEVATADDTGNEEYPDTSVTATDVVNVPDVPVEVMATTATADPVDATDIAADDDAPTPAPAADETTTDEDPAAADDTEAVEQPAARARRPKGSIAIELLAVMRAQPDTPLKVGQLSKLIDASPGAVANSLDKLAANGTIRMVGEKSGTYQAN